FPKLGKVGCQGSMEIGTSDQLHPCRLGKQSTESTALKRVRNSREAFPSLFVEQSLTLLHVRLHPVDDPEQPRRGPARQERFSGPETLPERLEECRTQHPQTDHECSRHRPAIEPAGAFAASAKPEKECVQPRSTRKRECRIASVGVPARLQKVKDLESTGQVSPEKPGYAEPGEGRTPDAALPHQEHQARQPECEQDGLSLGLHRDDL